MQVGLREACVETYLYDRKQTVTLECQKNWQNTVTDKFLDLKINPKKLCFVIRPFRISKNLNYWLELSTLVDIELFIVNLK